MVFNALSQKTDMSTPSSRHKALCYRAVFMGALILFVLAAVTASGGQAAGWESSLFRSINNWPQGLYDFMVIVTFFGSLMWAPIMIVIVSMLRLYRLAWRLAFTIMGAYAAAALFKHVIGRERPVELLHDIHLRVAETGMGFPSGHATLITVIALTLWPALPRAWRWTVPLAIILVCLSRLYLGVHVPLDIIGGVMLGTAAVAFCHIIPGPVRSWLRLN